MEETKQITKAEAPNSISFKYGTAPADVVKLYWEDEKDLDSKIAVATKAIKKIRKFLKE